MANPELREVLLVEDNEIDAELTILALKKFSLLNPVVHLNDGGQALDYLFCRGLYAGRPRANPCVILLDLALPKVHGIDLLRAIRANPWTSGIPVFVLTSSRNEEDFADARRFEATDLLPKPVEFVDFAGVIAKAKLDWGLFTHEEA